MRDMLSRAPGGGGERSFEEPVLPESVAWDLVTLRKQLQQSHADGDIMEQR